MATANTISQLVDLAGQSHVTDENADVTDYPTPGRSKSPVFFSPAEFKMRLLKRILSVDSNLDKRGMRKLQRHPSENAFKASIVFQNGEKGTLIAVEKQPQSDRRTRSNSVSSADDSQKQRTRKSSEQSVAHLPNLVSMEQEEEAAAVPEKKERPLKLPPICLPPIYSITPRPLESRDFSSPPTVPSPLTDEQWDDLEDCRYLRPAMKKFVSREPGLFVY